MGFEHAHHQFIQYHLSRRRGERKGRLERGHGHGEKSFAEKIWWVLKGNFDRLHPEFELLDWRSKPYFADFVYFSLAGVLKLIIEIKGFGTHVQEMDRQGHRRECERELFFEGLGYRVVSIAYDDIRDQPELIVAMLRMLLSQYESEPAIVPKLTFAENEIIRTALSNARPLRPLDLEQALGMTHRRAVGELTTLCESGWFRPITGKGGKRVVRYELIRKPFM
ncbi:MAG: hypothetical protein J7559_14755 [Cohnella sp.]|nr:hypothetical protein [Cohnella sp.]